MSLIVKIDGAEALSKENVRKIVYSTDVPLDSEARTKDVGSTLTIYGRILTPSPDDEDTTIDLDDWSLLTAEDATAYREVDIEVYSAGLVVRSYKFPHAFVVNYEEDFGSEEGVGTFILTVKQKKDKMGLIEFNGAFDAE